MRKTILVISAVALFFVFLFFLGKETYDWLDGGAQNANSSKSNDTNEHIVDVRPDNSDEVDDEIDSAEVNTEQTYFITEEDFAAFEDKGLNPFGKETKQEDLTDEDIQGYIHGMAHQKVRAEKKWGFYEIHPVRIEWLLEALDQGEFMHESVYRGILEKWQAGDFRTADTDHNKIWSLQGGTVGKATGLLSKEEELAYLKEQYKK